MATRPGFCEEDHKYYDFLLNEVKIGDYVVYIRNYHELHVRQVINLTPSGNCTFPDKSHVWIGNVISLPSLGINEEKEFEFDRWSKHKTDLFGNSINKGDKVLCTAGRYISRFIVGTVQSVKSNVVIKANYTKQAKKTETTNTFIKSPNNLISLNAYNLEHLMPENEWVEESEYYKY